MIVEVNISTAYGMKNQEAIDHLAYVAEVVADARLRNWALEGRARVEKQMETDPTQSIYIGNFHGTIDLAANCHAFDNPNFPRFELKIDRFHGAYKPANGPTPSPTMNQIYQVAIPNLGLLAIDEVFVENDLCTDQLQRYLNEGYRILAVCPPACQRRPDYILGRAKPHA